MGLEAHVNQFRGPGRPNGVNIHRTCPSIDRLWTGYAALRPPSVNGGAWFVERRSLRGDGRRRKCQTACKPGSVPSEDGDDHSSGPAIADRFSRPTRTPRAVNPANRSPRDVPIRSCSRRGLPCRPCCQARGGLLPHPFTLPCSEDQAVCFLWRYPSGRPGRKLSAAISPWSPDFPRRGKPRRDRPAV